MSTQWIEEFDENFQIISDIHLEKLEHTFDFSEKFPIISPCLILAGNIGYISSTIWMDFMEYVNINWEIILYVLGNTEMYNNRISFEMMLDNYYTTVQEKWPKILIITNRTVRIISSGKIWNIIGATAWGNADRSIVDKIEDFKKIKIYNETGRLLRISLKEYQTLHNQDIEFIINEVNKAPVKERLVIITHFPLTRENTMCLNDTESIKNNYANEIHHILKKRPYITSVSGHTQYKYDFVMDDIRYVSNYKE